MHKKKLKLPFNKGELKKLDKPEYMKNNYATWRKFRKDSNANYYILPVEMKKYLPLLKSNSLNLYLFYCLNSNNEDGTSWYSTDSLAKSLDASTRSINTWNNDLIDLGLIYRIHDGKKSATTFLLPLSNYFVKVISPDLNKYIQTANTDIDGELVSVIHLFQWRKNSEKEEYDQPYNVVLLTFEKTIHPKQTNGEIIKKKKYVLLEIEEEIKEFSISLSAQNFQEDIYWFESPLEGKLPADILVKGIALSTVYNLKDKDYRYVLDTIETLSESIIHISEDTVLRE